MAPVWQSPHDQQNPLFDTAQQNTGQETREKDADGSDQKKQEGADGVGQAGCQPLLQDIPKIQGGGGTGQQRVQQVDAEGVGGGSAEDFGKAPVVFGVFARLPLAGKTAGGQQAAAEDAGTAEDSEDRVPDAEVVIAADGLEAQLGEGPRQIQGKKEKNRRKREKARAPFRGRRKNRRPPVENMSPEDLRCRGKKTGQRRETEEEQTVFHKIIEEEQEQGYAEKRQIPSLSPIKKIGKRFQKRKEDDHCQVDEDIPGVIKVFDRKAPAGDGEAESKEQKRRQQDFDQGAFDEGQKLVVLKEEAAGNHPENGDPVGEDTEIESLQSLGVRCGDKLKIYMACHNDQACDETDIFNTGIAFHKYSCHRYVG